MRLVSCGLTDVGLKRSHNEDNYTCAEDVGLFVVADGMGGHAAGEVASGTAIDIIREFIRQFCSERDMTWPFGQDPQLSLTENAIVTAVRLANNAVCNLASQNQAYNGMGTTIVAFLAEDAVASVAHVGDSRLYRLREGRFDQLTLDHSWVNEQLQKKIITPEEAKSHRWRNVITRALGNRPDLEVDLTPVDLAPDDLYLLCSDGLSGMVNDEEIGQVLSENLNDIDKACHTLIDRANANGGIDNVTAVLIKALDEE